MLVTNNIKQKYSDAVLISQVFLYDKCQGLLYFCLMDKQNIDNDVPIFIKCARSRMKITQDVFAEKFGCTKANVSAWENGLHEPSYKQLRRISDESGVPLPSDKIGLLMDRLGITVDQLDVDQIDILATSLSVPKESRPQVKKVIGTFKETDTGADEEKSIEQ